MARRSQTWRSHPIRWLVVVITLVLIAAGATDRIRSRSAVDAAQHREHQQKETDGKRHQMSFQNSGAVEDCQIAVSRESGSDRSSSLVYTKSPTHEEPIRTQMSALRLESDDLRSGIDRSRNRRFRGLIGNWENRGVGC